MWRTTGPATTCGSNWFPRIGTVSRAPCRSASRRARIRVGAGEQGAVSARRSRAPETFEQLVLGFLADLEQERGLARNTVNAYRSDLVRFGAFLADRRRDVLAVEHAELAAFVDELANSRAGTPPVAGATLARKIACLRSFYRYLHRRGMIKHNPASELSNPRFAERRPQARTRRPRAPQTFEQLVLAFLTDLEQERGLARNTIDAYRSDLVQFGAFLADRRRDVLAVEHAERDCPRICVGTSERDRYAYDYEKQDHPEEQERVGARPGV